LQAERVGIRRKTTFYFDMFARTETHSSVSDRGTSRNFMAPPQISCGKVLFKAKIMKGQYKQISKNIVTFVFRMSYFWENAKTVKIGPCKCRLVFLGRRKLWKSVRVNVAWKMVS
jgi:hypothetical protein